MTRPDKDSHLEPVEHHTAGSLKLNVNKAMSESFAAPSEHRMHSGVGEEC
jgi:hypothetical protein